MTRQAVTKHLNALAEAGLVTASRRGREKLYRISPQPLTSAVSWMADLGITAIPRPRVAGHIFTVTDYYYLSGAAALVALVLQRNIVLSDFGRKIRAMKYNEMALGAVGVSVHREKVVVFVISAIARNIVDPATCKPQSGCRDVSVASPLMTVSISGK